MDDSPSAKYLVNKNQQHLADSDVQSIMRKRLSGLKSKSPHQPWHVRHPSVVEKNRDASFIINSSSGQALSNLSQVCAIEAIHFQAGWSSRLSKDHTATHLVVTTGVHSYESPILW